MSQDRELVMRLPPGRRYAVSYDQFGASLYAVASVTFQYQAVEPAVTTPASKPDKKLTRRQQRIRDAYQRPRVYDEYYE
jgi:hypothetical protein